MENNTQENNVNINITNNEEKKPEKKELPIYIIPSVIVLIICIVGGIFLSGLEFSEEKTPSTPSDEKTEEKNPGREENKEENNQDNVISTPNDDELIISTMTDDVISTPSN